jgi:hypothetical protein
MLVAKGKELMRKLQTIVRSVGEEFGASSLEELSGDGNAAVFISVATELCLARRSPVLAIRRMGENAWKKLVEDTVYDLQTNVGIKRVLTLTQGTPAPRDNECALWTIGVLADASPGNLSLRDLVARRIITECQMHPETKQTAVTLFACGLHAPITSAVTYAAHLVKAHEPDPVSWSANGIYLNLSLQVTSMSVDTNADICKSLVFNAQRESLKEYRQTWDDDRHALSCAGRLGIYSSTGELEEFESGEFLEWATRTIAGSSGTRVAMYIKLKSTLGLSPEQCSAAAGVSRAAVRKARERLCRSSNATGRRIRSQIEDVLTP